MNESHPSTDLPPVLISDPSPQPVNGEMAPIVIAKEVHPSHVFSYVVSWAVIIALVGLHILGPSVTEQEIRHEASKVDLLQVNIAAKSSVGIRKISPKTDDFLTVPEFRPSDFPEVHWGHAIIINELEGPEAGLEQIRKTREAIIENQLSLTEKQELLVDTLSKLFVAYSEGDWAATDVAQKDRDFVEERLGYAGKLALTPKQSPDQAARAKIEDSAVFFALALVVMMALFGLTLLAGCICLVIFLTMAAVGKLRLRFLAGSGRGHIYGETFAIWFATFTIMQVLIGILVPDKLVWIGLGFSFFGSLVALAWPVLRGVAWRDVRRDIGWSVKSDPLVEIAYGFFAYVAMTPLIVISILFIVVISNTIGPGMLIGQLDGKNAPSHPIVFELAKNEPQVLITTLILACIAAPIIEETMFRGVLYRHLRDSTAWFRVFVSFVLSAGANALIFAAIHPQGWLGIPVLGTLAFGFSVVREWRDSLIAPMTMHAINNGMMAMILLAILNGLN